MSLLWFVTGRSGNHFVSMSLVRCTASAGHSKSKCGEDEVVGLEFVGEKPLKSAGCCRIWVSSNATI